MLSPLVKGPRKEFTSSTRQRPHFKKHIPLYVDTSDDGESDKDCILILCVLDKILFLFAYFCLGMIPQAPNGQFEVSFLLKVSSGFKHTRGCFTETIGVLGQDVAKGDPLLDSPKKNAIPEFSQAARKSPSKIPGRSTHETKEQARQHKYAAELFAELNKDVFGDRLPKNTALEWSKRLLTTAGRARWHR